MDDEPFYALSLSASGGRAVVRDWIDTTVGHARQQLATWFDRHRIDLWSDDNNRYYGLRALAFATVREPRELPVTTLRSLFRAAFTRQPGALGHSVPSGTAQPRRADGDPSPGRPDQTGSAQS